MVSSFGKYDADSDLELNRLEFANAVVALADSTDTEGEKTCPKKTDINTRELKIRLSQRRLQIS